MSPGGIPSPHGGGPRPRADAPAAGHELHELLGERRSLLLLLDRVSLLRKIAEAARLAGDLDVSMVGDPCDGDAIILRGHVGIHRDGLRELFVPMGHGLGGKVSALRRPDWVPDYVSSSTITHDFDRPVREERLQAMVALPMVAERQFVGVLYGALRHQTRYGDAVITALQRVADEGATQLYLSRRLEERTESAVTAERSRIAADLHDSVGAMLFSTGAELRALQADSAASPELVSRLRDIERRLAEAASLFRQSLAALDDTAPQLKLTATLVEDCRSFESRTGVRARCVAVTSVPELPADRAAALVGLAREAMLNVEKHSAARSVVVSLAAFDGAVTLAVADDGTGWDRDADIVSPPGARRGRRSWSSQIGLRAARERLERVGGSLSVVDNEDGGVTVRAQVAVP